VRFADPEGLEHELVVVDVPDEPLRARSTEVPDEHALLGFHAVHAAVAQLARSARVLTDVLGATPVGEDAFELRGDARGNAIHFTAGAGRGVGGAGTIHHIAWAAPLDAHGEWRERVAAAGLQITPVIDRHYFRSVYFREPGGILFELASIGPGFTVDEPLESLGERLALPPDFEAMRGQVEPLLTPLPDVRRWRPAPVA
jgi:glyoxalase family protein